MTLPTLHKPSIIVIGAGISGLSTAWYLQRQGHKVQVLEADDRIGGNVKTIIHNGCIIEAGPNSLVTSRPLIKEMINTLGLSEALLPATEEAKKRYIGKQGQLHALPANFGQACTTPLLSWRGKLRILTELFIKPDYSEQSIYRFTQRRLGTEVADWLVDPFVSGVFAGDPKRLSVAAALPRLWALVQEHGSLTKAGITKARQAKAARTTKAKSSNSEPSSASNTAPSIATFQQGLGQWIDALAEQLNISLRCKIDRIEGHKSTGFTVYDKEQSWHADQVVLAVPTAQAANLLNTLIDNDRANNDKVNNDTHSATTKQTVADLYTHLNSIEYPAVASVSMAFNRTDIGHALNGFGALLPSLEQRQTLGVLFASSMFTGRCPQDKHLLTAFIGGSRGETAMSMNQAQRLDTILQDLAPYLDIKGAPLWCLETYWPCAIPQYHLGHQSKHTYIQSLMQQLPGLHLCSNYTAGVALGDCVEQAHGLAQSISTT